MRRGGGLSTFFFVAGVAFMIVTLVVLRNMLFAPVTGDVNSRIDRTFQEKVVRKQHTDPRVVQWAEAEFAKNSEGMSTDRKIAYAESLGLFEEADRLRAKQAEDWWASLSISTTDVFIGAMAVFIIAVVGLFLGRRVLFSSDDEDKESAASHSLVTDRGLPAPVRGGSDNLAQLRSDDPMFSRPGFYAFVQNLHRNAHWASHERDWSAVGPYVRSNLHHEFERHNADCRDIMEVVIGSIQVRLVAIDEWTKVTAEISGLRVERGIDNRVRVVRFMDGLRLQRPSELVSLPPERMVVLGCPACQEQPADVDASGQCLHCKVVTGWGQKGWQVTEVELRPRRVLEPLPKDVRYQAAASAPLMRDENLSDAVTLFTQGAEGFEIETFLNRAIAIFQLVMAATEPGQWKALRPLCTDIGFEQLRFSREQYEVGEQTNDRLDLRLDRVELARIEPDLFYTSVVVRFWWTLKDFVVDALGNVVDGDPQAEVVDSAYWTFQRIRGQGGVGGPLDACPACGVPIDQVDATGVCGACHAWLCDGSHSWVLARTDSVATYHEG